VRDGRLLDILDRTGDEYRYYSSSSSDKHHGHHSYRGSDRGYLPDEFKRLNPPTFVGDVKKSEM